MNNLDNFRKKIFLSRSIEDKKISHILKWFKIRNDKNKMLNKITKISNIKDWYQKKNGNIFHKSNQFFSIEAVKIESANEKEVSRWDQPILNQKHGGILAILTREKKNGLIEFLLYARKEAGDKDIKLCPSFSATQSNINLAHKGKKTLLSNIILNHNKKDLICKTINYEDGGRFWNKKNLNLLIKIKPSQEKLVKDPNFIWLNMTQIKKLIFKKGIINCFVKTNLFMI